MLARQCPPHTQPLRPLREQASFTAELSQEASRSITMWFMPTRSMLKLIARWSRDKDKVTLAAHMSVDPHLCFSYLRAQHEELIMSQLSNKHTTSSLPQRNTRALAHTRAHTCTYPPLSFHRVEAPLPVPRLCSSLVRAAVPYGFHDRSSRPFMHST